MMAVILILTADFEFWESDLPLSKNSFVLCSTLYFVLLFSRKPFKP